MFKDLAIAFAEAAGLKALVPRLGKLAKTAVAFLVFMLLFSAIGIISVFYLIYKLAVKPQNPTVSRLDQIELRLNTLESTSN